MFYPTYGYGILWSVAHVLIWVIAIIIIIWIIRLLLGRGGPRGHWRHMHMNSHMMGHDGSMEILRERYAKGEITKEQFDSMKKDLEQN